MPGTARSYGLADPFDAERAIDAQAHLMRDLLRAFGAVPLALAAYNAGSAPVRACGCIPPIPETQSYVANILGLLYGAGDPLGEGASALEVRLVRGAVAAVRADCSQHSAQGRVERRKRSALRRPRARGAASQSRSAHQRPAQG